MEGDVKKGIFIEVLPQNTSPMREGMSSAQINPESQGPTIISGIFQALHKKICKRNKEGWPKLQPKELVKIGGNGISRTKGSWIGKMKGGFLDKFKEVKGDWKDDESEARGEK